MSERSVSPSDHGTDLKIGLSSLDWVSPFNLRIDAGGRIAGMGPTLALLFDGADCVGQAFEDRFEMIAPRRSAGTPLEQVFDGFTAVKLRTRPAGDFRSFQLPGAAIPMAGPGETPQGHLIFLTPGGDLQILIEFLDLKQRDLSPADSSSELLFLLETQKQMLSDSIKMAERLKTARNQAERLAMRDPLTDLLNRRGLRHRLDGLMQTDAAEVAILHIDLDRFKQINDTFGHAAGDAVLCHMADLLSDVAGTQDFASRFGGDEFVLTLSGDSALGRASRAARRIGLNLTEPISWNGRDLTVGASIGIAASGPGEAIRTDALLQRADVALYDVKRNGRGRARVYDRDVMQREERMRQTMSEIMPGILRDEFLPFYQPQIDADTGRLIGVEVLVRWNHARRGLLLPPVFLDGAEAANLTPAIDRAVRKRALGELRSWLDAGHDIPGISFNLGDSFLRDAACSRELEWLADEKGIDPEMITVEILESVLLDTGGSTLKKRACELVDMGFRLSLDDFGTGHASLSSLIELPVSELEIDRSFIDGIAGSDRLFTMTETMYRMGKGLGISVLAEGVESKEDIAVLRGIGIEMMQGFYFARPMDARGLLAWLGARSEATSLAG